MATRIYRWLVRLHPFSFRQRFGAEMLCVYEEADSGDRPHLLADGVASLARQWVARSRYWIAGVALLGALLQLALAGTAWLGAARRARTGFLPDPSVSPDPSAPTAVLLLLAGLVCGVLLLTTAVASLVRGATRRKS